MKSSFSPCEDCQTPRECGQVAAIKQGMPCLPATTGGAPLPIDKPASEARNLVPDLLNADFSKFSQEEMETFREMFAKAKIRLVPEAAPAPVVAAVTVEVAKMSLLPGDIVLITVPDELLEKIEQIKGDMRRILPPGVQAMIKTRDIEIGILEKATA